MSFKIQNSRRISVTVCIDMNPVFLKSDMAPGIETYSEIGDLPRFDDQPVTEGGNA